jgi:hypothetical protein
LTKKAPKPRSSTRHRADDLTENGIEDVFNVALVKVRVLASDAPDEL